MKLILKNIYISAIVFALITLLSGCFGSLEIFEFRKKLSRHYTLRMCTNTRYGFYIAEGSNSINCEVFYLEWNDNFIVAKRRDPKTREFIGYYIIDTRKFYRHSHYLYGPLSEDQYQIAKKELNIPDTLDFKFDPYQYERRYFNPTGILFFILVSIVFMESIDRIIKYKYG